MAYTKVTGALVGSISDLDLTNVGDIQLDSISGDADTNTSITFSGSDVITVTTGGETQLTFNNGSILPTTNNDVDLGSDALEFKNAWFDGTVETDNLTIGGSQGSDGEVLTSTGSGVAWESAGGVSALDGLSDAKSGGANFSNSLLIGHQTSGTLSSASNNTGIGYAALDALTSGTNNTAVGQEALSALATSSYNTAVGKSALEANTAANNTAVGYAALLTNTTGADNTAIGKDALKLTTPGGGGGGDQNTAVGSTAMDANTSGRNNTGIGYGSLGANTTGDKNTAVGLNSLGLNATTDFNVAVGNGSLYNNVAADNTAVGYNALTANTDGINSVAVGSNALDAQTTVGYNTAVGYNSLSAITTGYNCVAFGSQAGALNTANNLAAFGANCLDANTSGSDNTGIGYASLSANQTSSNNTAVGSQALLSSTSASNTAVGSCAADALTIGSNNTAMGYNAMGANVEGSHNTALGMSAMRTGNTSHNVCVGSAAGYNMGASGGSATLIGREAGFALTTGANNTAVGYQAGDEWTTNGNNVAIGYHAAETSGTTCTDGVWIGYNCGTTEAIDTGKAGQVVIGASAQIGNFENCVAIGKSCPGQGTNTVTFGKSSSSKVNINWDTGTAWTYPSDERMKENIADMPTSAGLSFIKTLKPRTFTWRKVEDYDESLTGLGGTMKIPGDKFKKSEGTQYGFVAQEVKTAMEGASITPDPDGGGYGFWTQAEVGTQQGVAKEDLIPSLVKAIQELEARIVTLEG